LFDRNGLPYAPITKPEELFDDPHLNESGGLAELVTETGGTTKMPLLPLMMGGQRLQPRMSLPRIGAQTAAILADIGYSPDRIGRLEAERVVATYKGV
jgi:crotonobetainyl-CoA:carnitine CoA-transferase CaiB-like acyl-CoA transferase